MPEVVEGPSAGSSAVADVVIGDPILNGPYEQPTRHFELESSGPTGTILAGRRPSESFVPIPPSKKGQPAQTTFDFDATGERIERNALINDIRTEVETWRRQGYPGVTPMTKKLLLHWADPERENRVMFCPGNVGRSRAQPR